MQIIGLWRKGQGSSRAEGDGREGCDRLILQRGYGIVGDAYACPGSPRQILLVGTPTLEAFGLQPGQLRENILLDGDVNCFESGQTLQLGETALIRLTTLCEPCALLNTVQPGLARRIRGRRGRLGMVVRNGDIRLGDRLSLTPHRFPVIPETTRGKFEEFVCRIPPGRVVRTPDLLLALGLTASYYRTVPALIKKSPASLPVHRIVARDGRLLTLHLPEQRMRLQAEGIALEGDRVTETGFWEAMAFHDLGEG